MPMDNAFILLYFSPTGNCKMLHLSAFKKNIIFSLTYLFMLQYDDIVIVSTAVI